MSDTQETLTQVLVDIQANRKNLADQLVTQKQQVEVGEAQLIKFDTLIAALQHVVGDDNHLAAVDARASTNAGLVAEPGHA